MQYDVWCHVMQNDVMIWCKMMSMPKTHTHTGIHKLCIPLGTTFELLHLLFWWYKFCIPLGMTFELLRLIFQRYLALHSLWNDFWAENLHCAPLGTTLCIFGKLTLRSLERLFVTSVKVVMWFWTPRSLKSNFCASATLRVCGQGIVYYDKNEAITGNWKQQKN